MDKSVEELAAELAALDEAEQVERIAGRRRKRKTEAPPAALPPGIYLLGKKARRARYGGQVGTAWRL